MKDGGAIGSRDTLKPARGLRSNFAPLCLFAGRGRADGDEADPDPPLLLLSLLELLLLLLLLLLPLDAAVG